MSKRVGIIIAIVVAVAALGVGAFFIIKNVSEKQHKKDIEMAADCARTFETPVRTVSQGSGYIDTGSYTEYENNRRAKREECAEKYHVTHQEIVEKIGTEDYQPR